MKNNENSFLLYIWFVWRVGISTKIWKTFQSKYFCERLWMMGYQQMKKLSEPASSASTFSANEAEYVPTRVRQWGVNPSPSTTPRPTFDPRCEATSNHTKVPSSIAPAIAEDAGEWSQSLETCRRICMGWSVWKAHFSSEVEITQKSCTKCAQGKNSISHWIVETQRGKVL